ncbi:DUF4123 domain-containing protein [Rugamonas sp. FT107W]|uniref:DUF4123 domain-containing protein n=1 Tax=Duganella vulcania TaxID=2692166 RepID=A0A845HNJ7_9BURK|nr:DUF4123 domain-containing protein [Duganella vulcania]MYN18076.1 DUF4123 domain-containing protein [Duganella vulcania]
MNEATLQPLINELWEDAAEMEGWHVHWLLDGARDPNIENLVRSSGLEHACLFSGQMHPRLQAAAPYLIHLPFGSAAASRLLKRGWGNAWGIFTIARAEVTLAQQRLHLKKFLRVQTEDGKLLAFRYYDPRVLNTYLPTCTSEEFRTFLGPLSRIVAESDGGKKAIEFTLHDDAMRCRTLECRLDDAIQRC